MRYILLIFVLLIAVPAQAVMNPREKLNDPAMEARAQALTRTLRCVVCQNQSVEDSDADLARDPRIVVRKDILAGQSDDQIKADLRAKYGDYILLDPPFNRRTWALWFAPLLVLAAGIGFALHAFGRRRRK